VGTKPDFLSDLKLDLPPVNRLKFNARFELGDPPDETVPRESRGFCTAREVRAFAGCNGGTEPA